MKSLSMDELIKQYGDDLKRIDNTRKENGQDRLYFDARETGSSEDFIGKMMAAATVEGILVTSKTGLQTITDNLVPVLKQSFEKYDYMKGYSIGNRANEKCKASLKEAWSNSHENQTLQQGLEKALSFQNGGRQTPPPERPGKEIDGWDR